MLLFPFESLFGFPTLGQCMYFCSYQTTLTWPAALLSTRAIPGGLGHSFTFSPLWKLLRLTYRLRPMDVYVFFSFFMLFFFFSLGLSSPSRACLFDFLVQRKGNILMNLQLRSCSPCHTIPKPAWGEDVPGREGLGGQTDGALQNLDLYVNVDGTAGPWLSRL